MSSPTRCTNQSHESQHSAVTRTSLSESQASESVHEPAAEDIEGDNGPVEISDEDDGEDEQEEVEVVGSKRRKLTSPVWRHFERVKIKGNWKAKCAYCKKKLGGETKNGTKHLHDHLRSCVYVKIKNRGKTLAQSSLRFNSQDEGKISLENYTFDQDFARKELADMIVLHEYPLSIVDHTGFRRFVSALQPLFKMVTRNTIRYAFNIPLHHGCTVYYLF